MNPDDINNVYFLRPILIRTYGCPREQMFPTPNHSLPLLVQKIKINSCKQVKRLENIRYGRVVPDELRETTINAVPLVYDRFQVPTP